MTAMDASDRERDLDQRVRDTFDPDEPRMLDRPAFVACGSYDGDTGLGCLRERGHEPPHRCEIEWDDDDDEC